MSKLNNQDNEQQRDEAYPPSPMGAHAGCNCLGCQIMRELDSKRTAGPAASQQPECATCGGSGVLPTTGQTAENFQYGGPCPDCAHFNAPSEKATALQEYDSLKDQEFQQPSEAVSEAAREADEHQTPITDKAIRNGGGCHYVDRNHLHRNPTFQYVDPSVARSLERTTAAQQAEIAALREEAKRTENERRDWESIASSRLSLLTRAGNELRDCRAELATTRERLAKCEAQVAALEGTIERLGKGRSDDSDEIQSQRRTIQSYKRCAEAQEHGLREIRDFCDGYIDGAPDAGPLGKLANRIDVIAARALEGQSTP